MTATTKVVKLISFHLLYFVLLLGQVEAQFELQADVPKIPSPKKKEKDKSAENHGNRFGFAQGGFLSIPDIVPHQIPPDAEEPAPGPPLPPEPIPAVPFGLNNVILILVPQFKSKFRHLPKWIHSNIKVALPVTIFFDKLNIPPPFPFGPTPFYPMTAPMPPPPIAAAVAEAIYNPFGYSYGYYPYLGAYPYANVADADPETDDDDGHDEHDAHESYESGEEEYRSARNKRRALISQTGDSRPPPVKVSRVLQDEHDIIPKVRRKRAVPFNKTVHSAERAVLFPRLENMLETVGLGGKACLLRTICEVHEGPLHHYGLMGQLVTLFFSISRSMFAESHLPEYLLAEQLGRTGNCSAYASDCKRTLFSWEEKPVFRNNMNNILGD